MSSLPSRHPRVLLLSIALAESTGKRALHAALPAYFLVGIVALIAFAGNGMDASSVTSRAARSFPVRLGLLFAWGALTLPVVRLLLADPQTFFLRVLPVPRGWLLGITGVALAGVHVAWLVLWARGAGLLPAALAGLAVLGAQCHVIAGLRSLADLAGVTAVCAGWLLAPSALSLGLLLPAFAAAYHTAWARAPEPRAAGRHMVLTATPGLAMATAFGISAYRSNGSAVLRASLLLALAAVVMELAIHNDQGMGPEDVRRWALGLWGGACMLGAITLARPMLRAEQELGWVLDARGVPVWLRAVSTIAVLALLGAVLGVVFGTSIGLSSGAGPVSFATGCSELAVTGAAWGAIAAGVVRSSARGSGRDGAVELVVLLGSYCLSIVLLVAQPAWMLLFLLLAALLSSLLAARRGTLGTSGGQRAR